MSLLAGLPARGACTASAPSIRGPAPVVYVACHDTEPPSGQTIATDTTHLLVRALASKKAKEEQKGASGEAAAKRQRLAAELEAGPALTVEAVRSFTAEKVKAALSARGLVQSGNKEACVERLLAWLAKQAPAPGAGAGGEAE